MPGEPSKRSNIIDVTYQELHLILTGEREGLSREQVTAIIEPRVAQLKNITEPFGKPSDASKKSLDSGSVALADGTKWPVDEIDKVAAIALSDHFQIDQIHALVLFRAFIYNEGLPNEALANETGSFTEQLIKVITPFYLSERLSILRVLIPLFRANESELDHAYDYATTFLPKISPEGDRTFIKHVVSEYQRKTQATLPSHTNGDPRASSLWAKHCCMEQIILLEIMFWTMWSRVACDGPIVMRIFETAYETKLGSEQANSSYLLDEEGQQLQQDATALWILLTLEVLELERVGESLDITQSPNETSIYVAYPEALQRIHELIMSQGDRQFGCTYLAWAFVLSRLQAAASELGGPPENYRVFFQTVTQTANLRDKTPLPLPQLMVQRCFDPDANVIDLFHSLLTQSPLFITGLHLRRGSALTESNAVAFRSVMKGLLMSLVDLIPVEMIPEFDTLVEVWIALFGRAEPASIEGICQQFWEHDSSEGITRRAIFDVARTRFPIQPRYLLRLVRSMSAAGFLDTDPLSASALPPEGRLSNDLRRDCASRAFRYLDNLNTYTQLIPASLCSGPHAIVDRFSERDNSSYGVSYTNLRPIKLPGGSILPARSVGRVISGDTAEFVVVIWDHSHSGWKLVLELLTDYTNRRCNHYGIGASFSTRKNPSSQVTTMRLQEIGLEQNVTSDELVVLDVLDLLRSVLVDNPPLAKVLLESLESGEPVVSHTNNDPPPDLVQLTTMILEEALSRSSNARSQTRIQLIASSLSVLASLLSIREHSLRVWLYLRSSSSLFSSDRAVGLASSVLASERAVGHYTMTLSMLHLVQQLFNEASSAVLIDDAKVIQLKEDILLRAARFVHAQVWVEHTGWKYAQIGDRFEIGRRVTTFYSTVLTHSPPTLKNRPFASLSQAVVEAFLTKASMSTIHPLVSSLTTAGTLFKTFHSTRRIGEVRRIMRLLESHLSFTRLLLNCKEPSSPTYLLEQALCGRVTGGAPPNDPGRTRSDPIDVLASYVTSTKLGHIVPVEGMRVLYSLCTSLSLSEPSPPMLIGHLSNPEATINSLVRIVQNPYEDLDLRISVWNFISLAVDTEPALAGLLVTGKFKTPSTKGKEKEDSASSKTLSAIEIASATMEQWKDLWDANPRVLACILRFLNITWQHGFEHKVTLRTLRSDAQFWNRLVCCAKEELGPIPDSVTQSYVSGDDGEPRSDLHEAVSIHACRTMAKSHALRIIALDMEHFGKGSDNETAEKPQSYLAVEPIFKAEEELNDYILEAAATPYQPQLFDDLTETARSTVPSLLLDHLRIQLPDSEREFGDNFTFSRQLLRSRLQLEEEDAQTIDIKLTSMNLNLSLTYAQSALTSSWRYLLLQTVPFLRAAPSIRPHVLSLVASISEAIASEKRSGEMMATIYEERLSLLLALLELAWFSSDDTKAEIQSFISLTGNVRGIILSDTQPPAKSFLGNLAAPFHRTLLQIMYFCARHSRSLYRRRKALSAEQRLNVGAFLDSSLNIVIDALRVCFESALTRFDLDVDQDLELLVAVFEQCTRLDVNLSPMTWLTKCQETNVLGASLRLFSRTDLVGLSDLPLLRARRQPLYATHILTFHMALASIPSAAERLASEGVLLAYGENTISNAIRSGSIDVTIPELPGDRSPAHKAYCSMLAVVSGVTSALGRQTHFDNEVSGFVQLYGDQLSRALSWSIGDPLTLPYLEELEQVVNLFAAIARNLPLMIRPGESVTRILRVFTTHALTLIQHLNYALTHPNHLASLLEPVTAAERELIEKDRKSSFQSSSEIIDPMKRPFLTRLVHRLFKLTNGIIGALTDISGAERVLIGEQQDWLLHEALVVPHSKVVVGEPASLGTLFELGNCTLDILRLLIDRPPGQTITPAAAKATTGYEKPLDVREAVSATKQTLETVLMYAVTQMAMWLSKPEFDAKSGGLGSADMDMDEPLPEQKGLESLSGKERRGQRRATVSMADRLRRGMTGEMATDLQTLLEKTKPVMEKGRKLVGGDDVDIVGILSHFLKEHVLAS